MQTKKTETAAFGMGCFWGPDAFFGAREGIVRTRVGYAGGTLNHPTYRDIGDHTETVLVEFDSETISYSDLIELFWENHHFRYRKRRGKNQYASRIFYTHEEQKRKAETSKAAKVSNGEVATEIQPLNFTVAEDYHQKYRLRHSKMMKNFSNMTSEEFRDSPMAAKLNGYAAGHLDLDDIKKLDFDIKPNLKDRMMNSARKFI